MQLIQSFLLVSSVLYANNVSIVSVEDNHSIFKGLDRVNDLNNSHQLYFHMPISLNPQASSIIELERPVNFKPLSIPLPIEDPFRPSPIIGPEGPVNPEPLPVPSDPFLPSPTIGPEGPVKPKPLPVPPDPQGPSSIIGPSGPVNPKP